MNYEKLDYFGWILPAAAAGLAIYGAIKSGNDLSFLFAASVILLILVERRRTKIMTASLIRIVDEKGAIRGLIGMGGDGLQIGVSAETLNNNAIQYLALWGKTPHVAFTFGHSIAATAKEGIIERAPRINVAGEMMTRQWRSYSMNFSFNETTNTPDLVVSEHHKDGIISRHIHIS